MAAEFSDQFVRGIGLGLDCLVERDFLNIFRKFQNKNINMAEKTTRRVVEDDLTNVEFETSEDVEVIPTFDSMGLREDLLR